jgi:hypothetical protein
MWESVGTSARLPTNKAIRGPFAHRNGMHLEVDNREARVDEQGLNGMRAGAPGAAVLLAAVRRGSAIHGETGAGRSPCGDDPRLQGTHGGAL